MSWGGNRLSFGVGAGLFPVRLRELREHYLESPEKRFR
jgi:hypothetical protein